MDGSVRAADFVLGADLVVVVFWACGAGRTWIGACVLLRARGGGGGGCGRGTGWPGGGREGGSLLVVR